MKLQPTSPTFIQERDAILKADTLLYNAQHACRIWAAFAKRGLGASAVSGTNSLGDETEAFDVPLSCDPTQTRIRIQKSGPVKLSNGAIITYTIKVNNLYNAAINNLGVQDTLDNALTFQSATKGGVQNGQVVSWTLNLAANDSVELTVTAFVSTTTASTEDFGDDHEGTTHEKWTVTSVVPNGQWTLTTNASQAYSGSKYWFAEDVDSPGSNTSLQTTETVTVNSSSELVFIHKFATEAGFDGGVVEVSEDGTTWTYLPPTKFVKGNYKSIIATTDNAFIGTSDLSAFSGASDGYIVSIAKLNDYIGKSIYIRFRMVADATGGHADGGGWWIDDVYVLENRTELVNTATAYTVAGEVYDYEGSNARASTSGFVLNGSVLPNNLGPLTAAVNRQAVELKWLTFTENNTASFTIERKIVGSNEFVKIGSVQASGSSSLQKTYSFTDASVTTNNKYQFRIKQNSKSGTYIYTNIALVQLGGKEFRASVYPNPVENTASLSILNPAGDKITINVYDGLGKKLFVLNGGNVESQLINLPVKQLKAGTYWIEVSAGVAHSTLQLIKK